MSSILFQCSWDQRRSYLCSRWILSQDSPSTKFLQLREISGKKSERNIQTSGEYLLKPNRAWKKPDEAIANHERLQGDNPQQSACNHKGSVRSIPIFTKPYIIGAHPHFKTGN